MIIVWRFNADLPSNWTLGIFFAREHGASSSSKGQITFPSKSKSCRNEGKIALKDAENPDER
jgi:hypothetical protein